MVYATDPSSSYAEALKESFKLSDIVLRMTRQAAQEDWKTSWLAVKDLCAASVDSKDTEHFFLNKFAFGGSGVGLGCCCQ